MDAAAPLAGQLVQLLGPFLPYLVKAGEGLGAKAAQQLEDKGLGAGSVAVGATWPQGGEPARRPGGRRRPGHPAHR
jgi:hypothetical protein